MKIGWVGPEEGLRFELLKELAAPTEVEIYAFEDLFKKAQAAPGTVVLFHPEYYEKGISFLKIKPESVYSLGFFDGVYFQSSMWSAWNSYSMAFQQMFSKKSEFLDSGASCLVVGECYQIRVAISELFRMGFRKFQVLRKPNDSANWIEGQSHHLFGVQCSLIDPKDLVHASGGSSVLLYGPASNGDTLYENELSYLNFLTRPGLVTDFSSPGFLFKILQDTQEDQLGFLGPEEIERSCIGQWLLKSKP